MARTSGSPGQVDLIRVVVVDDHPLFAQGTVEVLDRLPGIRAVGFATSLDDAVTKIAELKPDVVVCDVMLGDKPNGFELVARLRDEVDLQPPVIFLSQFSNAVLHRSAISAGAAGYMSKTADGEALRAAILAVHGGSTVFPRAAAREREGSDEQPRLPSPRELQILELVADGRSNAEIGAQLGISDTTVETHVSRLRARYAVGTRTQLALLADRQGWLTPRR
jgi:DNA-binding NarL/FixJ family response regulator